ncbi:hypothetical protein LCGC14_0332210 [marine sediment metagenome]|uniref:Gp5/Type VI secretion system Vgr protein OB-fold domain-containing protein n=1 Tax=marine sediment metagenome TaxID=412755 RepID=A0A0F9TZ19_9ZZZZ
MVSRNLDKIGGIPLGTGILLGIVIDNVDTGTPDRGRCKVWFPLIHGPEQPESFELPFAENALSFGGLANTGFVIIPEVGASVACGFELGFIEEPIMLGYWYGEEGLPDQHPTGETRDKVITLQRTDSETGDRFLLQIDFTDNSFKVTRTTSEGDDFLEVGKDGIKAETAEGNEISIDRQGNVNVNAQGDVLLGGGALPATGQVVTTEHIDPFTGAPHPQGSVNVKASL